MPKSRQTRTGPTVVGHDNSTVTAVSRGGDMHITAHDHCKVALIDESDQAHRDDGPEDKINWTKWGTILGGVGILVSILIAVVTFYAQTH